METQTATLCPFCFCFLNEQQMEAQSLPWQWYQPVQMAVEKQQAKLSKCQFKESELQTENKKE
jgi:hypothetical protein